MASKLTSAAGSGSFDLPDPYITHGYQVSIPRARFEAVRVWEVFGRPPSPEERELRPEMLLRAELARERWDLVSGDLKAELNRRLKAEGKPAGRFTVGDTAVQRLLGKEALVLVWAVEGTGVSEAECAAAVRNWLGLKPEERWWLYTMTAATTGLAHHVGQGWRGALRQALTFGTATDRFGLGAMTVRGTMEPRANPAFAAPRLRSPARTP